MLRGNTRNLIMGGLRKAFSRSPQARDCRANAKHPSIVGSRGGARYTCACCGNQFGSGEMSVDHIDVVIPTDKMAAEMSWSDVIDRLFCSEDNLQLLCKVCHDTKTNIEREERVKTRDRWRREQLKEETLILHEDGLMKKYKDTIDIEKSMFKKSALTDKQFEEYGHVMYISSDGSGTNLK